MWPPVLGGEGQSVTSASMPMIISMPIRNHKKFKSNNNNNKQEQSNARKNTYQADLSEMTARTMSRIALMSCLSVVTAGSDVASGAGEVVCVLMVGVVGALAIGDLDGL